MDNEMVDELRERCRPGDRPQRVLPFFTGVDDDAAAGDGV
jgi:hypothetical protein